MKAFTAFQGENVGAESLGRRKRGLWGSREKWGEEVSGGSSHSPKEEGAELSGDILGWKGDGE